MNRFARLATACAIALAVAACGGQAPVTKIDNTVASYCLESRSEYAGYRDFCDVTRACTASDKSKSKSLHDQAQKICTANPVDTATNRTAVKGIVAQQRAVGVAP